MGDERQMGEIIRSGGGDEAKLKGDEDDEFLESEEGEKTQVKYSFLSRNPLSRRIGLDAIFPPLVNPTCGRLEYV
jgi:hypothetical protein